MYVCVGGGARGVCTARGGALGGASSNTGRRRTRHAACSAAHCAPPAPAARCMQARPLSLMLTALARRSDLDFITKMVDKTALARLQQVAATPFKRCTYTDAIALLEEAVAKGRKFEHPVRACVRACAGALRAVVHGMCHLQLPLACPRPAPRPAGAQVSYDLNPCKPLSLPLRSAGASTWPRSTSGTSPRSTSSSPPSCTTTPRRSRRVHARRIARVC